MPDYLSARLKPLISKENFCLLLWLSLMHYALGYQFKFIYVFLRYPAYCCSGMRASELSAPLW